MCVNTSGWEDRDFGSVLGSSMATQMHLSCDSAFDLHKILGLYRSFFCPVWCFYYCRCA